MGYCTYTVRPSDGLTVAAWIGTGTDQGHQVTVTYRKGSTNKTAACNDVRNQFCKKYGCAIVSPARPYKTAACPGRCPTNQYCSPSTGYKCVNNPTSKPPTYAPNSRLTYKAPTPAKSTSSGSGSSSGGQDVYCSTNCDAEPLFDNLWCRLRKMNAYCGGNPGGPVFGNPFNFSGSALDPQQHSAICSKNCDALDVLCKGAKVQAGCGGTDYTFWIIAGVAGVVGVVILTRLLK